MQTFIAVFIFLWPLLCLPFGNLTRFEKENLFFFFYPMRHFSRLFALILFYKEQTMRDRIFASLSVSHAVLTASVVCEPGENTEPVCYAIALSMK